MIVRHAAAHAPRNTELPDAMIRLRIACLAAACLLAGCASPRLASPIALPPQYGAGLHDDNARTATLVPARDAPAGDAPAAAHAQDAWWRDFGDAELDRLVEDVLARNRDLQAAALRVERARLSLGEARDARLPTPGASVGDNRSRPLEGGDLRRSANAQFALSYELDLWGRLRNAERGAEAGLRAAEADRDAAALSLAANVCELYWRLGDANFRGERAARALSAAERTRALVEAQYAAGAVSRLELAEAEQNLQRRRESLSRLAQDADALRNALAVLRDGLWWPRDREPQRAAAAALPIDIGLPAQLLARRPDLRAGEWRLRRSLREVEGARLDAFPRIGLELGASGNGPRLADVLDAPLASLIGNLTLPLLDANGTRLRIAGARTDHAIAEQEFRQRLNGAVGEVEEGLAARPRLDEQTAIAEATLAEAERIERLYAERYRAGAAPLRLWLEAQQSLWSAQSSRSQAELAQRRNDVALAQALGGGARAQPQ